MNGNMFKKTIELKFNLFFIAVLTENIVALNNFRSNIVFLHLLLITFDN